MYMQCLGTKIHNLDSTIDTSTFSATSTMSPLLILKVFKSESCLHKLINIDHLTCFVSPLTCTLRKFLKYHQT